MGTHHRQARSAPVAGVLGQPLPNRAGRQRAAAHVEPLVDLGSPGRGQRVEQPVAQHPKLQVVEEPVNVVAIPGLQPQRVRGLGQRHVANQVGELTVAHHAGQVRPQRIAHLAAHGVNVVHQ